MDLLPVVLVVFLLSTPGLHVALGLPSVKPEEELVEPAMLVRLSCDSVTAGGRKSGCASPAEPLDMLTDLCSCLWHSLISRASRCCVQHKAEGFDAEIHGGKKGTRKCRHCVKIFPHLYVVHIGCVATGSLTLIGQCHTQNGWIQTYTLWTLAIQTWCVWSLDVLIVIKSSLQVCVDQRPQGTISHFVPLAALFLTLTLKT